MKDLGEASYILGIKIIRDRMHRKLSLSYQKYIETFLYKFKMNFYNDDKIPYDVLQKLSIKDCPTSTQDRLNETLLPYASAVGSLMYALMCTRPGLDYAVGVFSRFQSNPGESHWKGIKQVFCYLKHTKSYVLTYQANELQLIGYSDFDYKVV